jgi:hypothetical protein
MNLDIFMSFVPLHFVPLFGTLFYILFPSDINIHPTVLKYFIYLHNFGLHIFSGYIAFNLLGWFWELGIDRSNRFYLNYSEIDTLVYYFYLSKYYEYFDTFILYAKKIKPIFLQKFHHVGAVIVWNILYINRMDIIVYTTLFNSVVHTFMYLYYFLAALKFKVNKYKIYITVLQLTQLIGGLSLFMYLLYENEPKKCSSFIYLFYGWSLVALFLKFFVTNYIFGAKDE